MQRKPSFLFTAVCLTLLTVFLSYGLRVKHNGALALHSTVASAAITGTVAISPGSIPAGQPITITVTDADLIASTSVPVTVVNQTTLESETVTLPVSVASSGTFVGTLATTNAVGAGTNNSGNMNVQSGQSIQVTYNDASNLNGVPVTASQTALVAAGTSIPSPVTGLLSTFLNNSSVRLNWDKSTFTGVSGYKLYFGTASRTYTGTSREGASPLKTFGNMTTLSHLPTATLPTTLPAVTNLGLSPFSQGLTVTWSPVAGATGYKVYYSTSTFDSSTLPANPISLTGGATSYKLTGLTNGTTYFVAVTAVALPRYYFAVTAAIDPSLATSTPGTANESNYSTEVSQDMGSTTVESTITSTQSAIPEVIVAYPNLKNEGCFIATAAYGFYSAPQVQVLRDFRDQYLLTNAPGRAFVAWYYRHGPNGARFLNQHPVFKPLVRVGLLPLVAGALFLVATPVAVKITALLAVIVGSTYLALRKKFTLCGGVQ